MRRICILFLALFLTVSIPVFAEDWSDIQGDLWGSQKSITNVEFEKAIDTLQAKQKKKEAKQKRK